LPTRIFCCLLRRLKRRRVKPQICGVKPQICGFNLWFDAGRLIGWLHGSHARIQQTIQQPAASHRSRGYRSRYLETLAC
jgi:hypothetical protein